MGIYDRHCITNSQLAVVFSLNQILAKIHHVSYLSTLSKGLRRFVVCVRACLDLVAFVISIHFSLGISIDLGC